MQKLKPKYFNVFIHWLLEPSLYKLERVKYMQYLRLNNRRMKKLEKIWEVDLIDTLEA